ncbi:hypothetical protein M011DRAFT_413207 [Sporormia fimetaria CBS 119925]|uniref:Uncharacterized protein n=1 Tax=Sporormia fimetaria CBS 119925 TaxID=1340428 RepID=A0A6A6UV64_9PLEO|nr:hypothetical protein M011DRAFT_413207 [Sporormia fimetaria CBS 119925]
MEQSRRIYSSLLGGIVCLTTITNTILSILEAASLSSKKASLAGLPVAASVFGSLSVCCVAVFLTQYVRTAEGRLNRSIWSRRIVIFVCVSVSSIAAAITLASIITMKSRLDEMPLASAAIIKKWSGFLAGHIFVWTITTLLQAGLFLLPLWVQRGGEKIVSIPYNNRASVMSEVRTSEHTTNMYALEPTLPFSPLAKVPSSTFSERSSHSLRGWRESLNQAVRPMSSRAKLLHRPSSTRDAPSLCSDAQSISNQSDGFETWDTSSVPAQTKEAAGLSVPSRGTALEPIPGSRPASPARALDGPFQLQDEGSEVDVLPPPPKLRPDTSRPPSPVVSEGHIHPLFRSESPVPPPEVLTPGTNVMASPLSTQMIACPPRPYGRMRSNSSRNGSPSLLSNESFRGRAASSPSSRSPSPPSRELTPPIPDPVPGRLGEEGQQSCN